MSQRAGVPLPQDIQAQGLDHHDMSVRRASLRPQQAAVNGWLHDAFLPHGSEEALEDAEAPEMVAKRERLGSL